MSDEYATQTADDQGSPEVETEEVAASQITDQVEGDAEGEGVEGDDADDQTQAAADNLEEVEWEGEKARVPPKIKSALMRTVDYTLKTQELAQQRQQVTEQARAWEQQRTQQAELIEALKSETVAVVKLEDQAAEFDKVAWDELFASDRALYDQLRHEQHKVLTALPAAKTALSAKEGELAKERDASRANQRKELGQALAKAIPDFSPQKFHDIATYAISELGFTTDDLGDFTDVRAWQTFERLRKAEAELKDVKSKTQKAQAHVAAQQTKPASTVSTKGQFKPGLDDSLPNDEWMRRRNAQVAKRT